jgi:hypothetical protein
VGKDREFQSIPRTAHLNNRTITMNQQSSQNFGRLPCKALFSRGYLPKMLAATAVGIVVLASVSIAGEEGKQVTIPAGTSLQVKLDKAVSSTDKPGTQFSGVLQGDLQAGGVVAVKAGSVVQGKVMESKKAKRVRGKAQVSFALEQLNVNGQMMPVVTQPIEDIAASSLKKTAKGAAVGAAVGGIADGGEGAGKGAAIGAGASALKKGEEAGVAAGTVVEFKLAAPLTVTVKQ